MKRLSLLVLGLTVVLFVSCGSGPAIRGETENNVITNIEDGEINVSINSAVSMSFTAPISVASVNANTFFIVSSAASASESTKSIQLKSALNSTVCNLANAIAGTVAQTGSGACDTVFELTPDSAFEFSTGYVVCATNGISFCNPNTYGVFDGLQKSFTTVADTGVTYSIGGTVSGLSGTVVLQNNAADDLTITENESFTFATEIEADATYEVTVKTQPDGQTCSISSGTGTAEADVTTVAVTCSNIIYTVTPSGTNVTIDPSTVQTVAEDGTTSFDVTADATYTLSATVGGNCPAGDWAESTYTTGAVTFNCTVVFSGEEVYDAIYIYSSAETTRGDAIGNRATSTATCSSSYTSREIDIGCTNFVALLGYIGDNGVTDLPDNYDLPTYAEIQLINATAIADDWDALITNNPPLALYEAPEVDGYNMWSGFDIDGGISITCGNNWDEGGLGGNGVFLNEMNDRWYSGSTTCSDDDYKYYFFCLCW